MNFRIKIGLVVAAVLLGVAVVVPGVVTAQEQTVNEPTRVVEDVELGESTELRQRAAERRESALRELEERKEAARERLGAERLVACENREKNIKERMARIQERGTQHLDLFTTISERTQKFYTTKQLDFGEYESLVAATEEKRVAAEAALKELGTFEAKFDCSGEGPRAVGDAFMESRKQTIKALQAYRTSVKDLIVGVKTAVGATVQAERVE